MKARDGTKHLVAWHLANMLNAWRGKGQSPVTVKRLLGQTRSVDSIGGAGAVKDYFRGGDGD